MHPKLHMRNAGQRTTESLLLLSKKSLFPDLQVGYGFGGLHVNHSTLMKAPTLIQFENGEVPQETTKNDNGHSDLPTKSPRMKDKLKNKQ